MTSRPLAIVCTQSDLVSDYRIHKMSTTLKTAGFDVQYVTRSHHLHKDKPTADIHIMRLLFERGPLFYAEFNLRLLWHLLWRRCRLVVSIDLDTLAACYIASRITGKQLLWDSHEYFPEVPEIADKPAVKWVWNKVQDIFVPHLNHCVTVCQSIADIFFQRYGKQFHVIRNAPLSTRATDHQAIPSQYPRNTFTILYLGAVNIGRGVEETIQALTQLPDCRLLVVGEGDVYQQCISLAQSTGVADRVIFTGRKPFNQLAPYMHQADLGICLFRNLSLNYYYCLPNRLFDFIQAGLPLMAVDFPEISRIVKGYNVGITMPEISVQGIVDAVRYAQSHPDEVAIWKKNMQTAAQELIWENDAKTLLPELQAIIHQD